MAHPPEMAKIADELDAHIADIREVYAARSKELGYPEAQKDVANAQQRLKEVTETFNLFNKFDERSENAILAIQGSVSSSGTQEVLKQAKAGAEKGDTRLLSQVLLEVAHVPEFGLQAVKDIHPEIREELARSSEPQIQALRDELKKTLLEKEDLAAKVRDSEKRISEMAESHQMTLTERMEQLEVRGKSESTLRDMAREIFLSHLVSSGQSDDQVSSLFTRWIADRQGGVSPIRLSGQDSSQPQLHLCPVWSIFPHFSVLAPDLTGTTVALAAFVRPWLMLGDWQVSARLQVVTEALAYSLPNIDPALLWHVVSEVVRKANLMSPRTLLGFQLLQLFRVIESVHEVQGNDPSRINYEPRCRMETQSESSSLVTASRRHSGENFRFLNDLVTEGHVVQTPETAEADKARVCVSGSGVTCLWDNECRKIVLFDRVSGTVGEVEESRVHTGIFVMHIDLRLHDSEPKNDVRVPLGEFWDSIHDFWY